MDGLKKEYWKNKKMMGDYQNFHLFTKRLQMFFRSRWSIKLGIVWWEIDFIKKKK